MRFSALLAAACLAGLISATLVNDKVERTIDLTTHIVKETVIVTVTNKGSSDASSYELSFAEGLKPSYVSAKRGEIDLEVEGNKVAVKISAGSSVELEIHTSYPHAEIPLPEEIAQDDVQYVKFNGNVYLSTPYLTKTQTTVVKAAGPAQSYSKVKPFKLNGEKGVTYGPYEDIAANSFAELSYHFETKAPFLTVTNLVREIEVSHWGNVAVTEDVSMRHSGAKLKGSFSRLDFQRNPNSARNAIKQFESHLPAAATDVYYRDVIGNVSTSNLRVSSEAVVVQLRPRFPLFGGWKTQYTIGYNLPSYEVLSHSGSAFTLSIRFVDHIYDDMVIDEAEVRVILPEGATNVKVNTPFSTQRLENQVRVTYLDTDGRPVVVLRKSNLVEQHMQDFEVTYEFSTMTLLREPFFLITFFAIIFLVVIIVNRIDMSLIKKKDVKLKLQ
jgi:oligosaccharyltransferase complex subunit alpha (ribophorin I)